MSSLTREQTDFIATYAPLAQDISDRTGLHPSVALGLVAQETGWGKHIPNKNLFGISPGGQVASYPDEGSSAQAFVDLMQSKPYAGVSTIQDPDQQALAIGKAGYNPSPYYGTTVSALAKQMRDAGVVKLDKNGRPVSSVGKAAAAADETDAPSLDDLQRQIESVAPTRQPGVEVTTHKDDGTSDAPSIDELSKHLGLTPDPAPATAPTTTVDNAALMHNGPADRPTIASDNMGIPQPGPVVTQAPPSKGIVDAIMHYPGNMLSGEWEVAKATGQGLVNGWGGGPTDHTQDAQNLLGAKSPLVPLVGPAMTLGDAALRGGSALLGAYQGGVSEAGNQLGVPQLGRDLAAIPESLGPDGSMVAGEGRAFVNREAGKLADQGDVMRHTVTVVQGNGRAFQMHLPDTDPAVVADIQQNAEAYQHAGVNPTLGHTLESHPVKPRYQSATPEVADADLQAVLTPSRSADSTIYVPGTRPTAAEVSADPAVAYAQKKYSALHPDEAKSIQTANNDARVAYLQANAGGVPDVNRLKGVRAAQAEKDIAEAFPDPSQQGAWRDATPFDSHLSGDQWRKTSDDARLQVFDKSASPAQADLQPVADKVKSILTDPILGQNDAVNKYVGQIRDKLFKADGSPKITDPKTLYGVRQNINDLLDRASPSSGDTDSAAIRQARSQILNVRGAVDDAIEQAAPGYNAYRQNYAANSRPVEALDYLQEHVPSLVDGKGNISLNKFSTFMRDTLEQRKGSDPSPAKSLTDDQMRVLKNIHTDLQRQNNVNLGGSPPPPSLGTMLLDKAKSISAEAAIHHGGNLLLPGFGPVAAAGARHLIFPWMDSVTTANKARSLLNPDLSKYPSNMANPITAWATRRVSEFDTPGPQMRKPFESVDADTAQRWINNKLLGQGNANWMHGGGYTDDWGGPNPPKN